MLEIFNSIANIFTKYLSGGVKIFIEFLENPFMEKVMRIGIILLLFTIIMSLIFYLIGQFGGKEQ